MRVAVYKRLYIVSNRSEDGADAAALKAQGLGATTMIKVKQYAFSFYTVKHAMCCESVAMLSSLVRRTALMMLEHILTTGYEIPVLNMC